MRNCYLLFLVIAMACQTTTNANKAYTDNQQEFKAFIKDLKDNFIYLDERKDVVDCIEQTYYPFVDTISRPYYKVLFYEQLLNELNDSHIHLNSNTGQSYRLYAPVYVAEQDGQFYVKNVFSSQWSSPSLKENILGAKVISFNNLALKQRIGVFATSCHDKNDQEAREWVANKILAGKLHEPRTLQLGLQSGDTIVVDIDQLIKKEEPTLLTSQLFGEVGYIRINNSLGNSSLVPVFDSTLNAMMDTRALILDLRNTVDGGNTDVAEPVMGRFILEETGYQVCENKSERYTRSITPKGDTYTKPLFVLAGRWTGSMGEGMAIGFDGMKRGTVVGTELHRLAGGMTTIPLKHSNFGFRLSVEKMFHLDGTPRERFVPAQYVEQSTVMEDEFLAHALRLAGSK